MKKQKNKVSVIVVAYNEEKNIEKCLESVKKQGFSDYELISVVGGSDNTYDIASKHCDVVLRDKANAGAGPARNQGAKIATGEILAFTDGDCVLESGWLGSLVGAFSKRGVVAAGGPVLALDGGLKERVIYKITSDWLYYITSLVGFYQLSGNNCAYSKDAFMAVGGFDESLSMLEDTILSNKIKKQGAVVFAPKAIVYASTRRMQRDGFFRMFFLYMRAYFHSYLLKRPLKAEYFDSAKNKGSIIK